MKLVWKIVITVVLVMLAIGLVAVAIGLFTGGSIDRMLELTLGGRENFFLLLGSLKDELADIFKAYFG